MIFHIPLSEKCFMVLKKSLAELVSERSARIALWPEHLGYLMWGDGLMQPFVNRDMQEWAEDTCLWNSGVDGEYIWANSHFSLSINEIDLKSESFSSCWKSWNCTDNCVISVGLFETEHFIWEDCDVTGSQARQISSSIIVVTDCNLCSDHN